MSSVVWLASYPRSGNTWLRFLMANLLYGDLGNPNTVGQLIPDIHVESQPEIMHYEETVLVKTHFLLNAQLPFFWNTAGFIYLVRHPISTMFSCLNFYYLTHYEEICNLRADDRQLFPHWYIQNYIQNQGESGWLPFGFGNWNQNVASWLKNAYEFPSLIVRYEDLRADTRSELHRISQFLGIEAQEEMIKGAIQRSALKVMKRLEEADPSLFYGDFLLKGYQAGYRCVNGDTAIRWQDQVPLSLLQQAQAVFEPYSQKLGYEDIWEPQQASA